MSDHRATKHRPALLRHIVAGFVFLFAIGVTLAPQAAFAEALSPEDMATFSLPTTCTDLLVVEPEQPAEETPADELPPQEAPDEPDAEQPTWTALEVTGAEYTNTQPLVWQWQTPTSTNPEATFSGYGYAVYNNADNTLLTAGTLSPEVLQYSYAASGDASYRFYIWVNDTTEAEPTETGCEYRDTVLDTVGPIIIGNTYDQTGDEATPQLTTEETDVTYSWTTDGTSSQIEISDPTSLTPTFTFLTDGTFIFNLVALDSAGNRTDIGFEISYVAPFIPTPEAPLPTPETPPIDEYIAPTEVLVQERKSVLDTYNYGATAYNDTFPTSDVATNTTTTGEAVTGDEALENADDAAPVESSGQGWVILGVPWYWWLLGIAIVFSGWQWYRSGVFRKSPDDV